MYMAACYAMHIMHITSTCILLVHMSGRSITLLWTTPPRQCSLQSTLLHGEHLRSSSSHRASWHATQKYTPHCNLQEATPLPCQTPPQLPRLPCLHRTTCWHHTSPDCGRLIVAPHTPSL